MKITATKNLPNGRRQLTVEVDDNEDLHATKANSFYKLGAQMDDIVSGHALNDTTEVYWNMHEQKWSDA